MRFKKITFQFVVLFFFVSSLLANSNSTKGYNIEVNAPFQEGSIAYLASYWQDNTYVLDSITIPKKGIFSFKKENVELATGQYLLFIKPDIQINLLLDGELNNIKITLDKKNLLDSKIEGSKDTQVFWSYLKEANVINTALKDKLDLLNTTTGDTIKRKKIKEEYTKLRIQADELLKQYIKKSNGTWVGAFLKAYSQPLEPHLPPLSRRELFDNKHFAKQHYWDNIDFDDTRLWNTNILVPKIKEYLNTMISQHPDSIAKQSSWIVSQTENNPIAFEKMLSYLVNDATTSQVMGMENVWTKLAEDYIFDKDINWIDSKTYNQLKADYSLVELNRLGMKAQDLLLTTIGGDSINTNKIDAEYTILYFYSPTCSYCITEIPRLKKEIYNIYKDRGVKVVAINLEDNMEQWKSFIERNNISEWYNVGDFVYKSNYWLKYNVSGTPSLYLLGKDKTILAKKLNVDNLKKYLERLIQ